MKIEEVPIASIIEKPKSAVRMAIKNIPNFLPAENEVVISNENYDSYLTTLYGNWRELPPESKRVSNHANLHYDLKTSYME